MSKRTTRGPAAVAGAALLAAVTIAQDIPLPRPVGDPPATKDIAEPERYPPKLIYKPTPVPDRVVLTWKGDPATTQAVTWRTDPSVTSPVAEIALADPGAGVEKGWRGYDSKKVATIAAQTVYLKTGINESLYHSVNFDGLTPRTQYMYRVGDGANWSEWFHFETASMRAEPFGFIYFGDAQNGIKSLWSRIARGAYSDMPKAKFIVHAGDLVNSGVSDTDWGEWHSAAGWINGMVPSIPTPGNHEYIGGLTKHWRPQFTLPENGPVGLEETCYYLDYQGVRVISLNSNEKLDVQTAWLEAVLASRPPSVRWTVVTFHHPIYSTAKGRDNKRVREAWRPIFDRHVPDLVLQGHDHTYGRSGLMQEDNLLDGLQLRPERGTVYVVSVSGAKLYDVGDLPWAASKAQGVQLYQLIQVDGDRLHYEARTARGDVYDSFDLRKRPDGSNELIEGAAPDAAAPNHRQYWNAAGAVVILASLLLGLRYALKR
jgi:hypothetical protein